MHATRMHAKESIMKRFIAYAVLGAPLFAVLTLAPASSFAEHRCDHPKGVAEERACAKSAEGPDALRRFVQRTAAIWGLSYRDYARDRDEPTANEKEPAPATATRTAATQP
jgi:hypothetical protein